MKQFYINGSGRPINVENYQTFLVTGAAGFIGSYVTLQLLQSGRKVIALDDLSTGSLSNLAAAQSFPNFEFINAKMPSEAPEVIAAFKRADFVLHFAARVGVELVINSPTELMVNNLLSTEQAARLCLEYSVPIIISSSSEVYGKRERDCLSEGDYSYLPHPGLLRWAYSISKISDEFIIHDYKRRGLRAIIGRYFNFIGPGQSGDYGMVVPRFVRQAISGKPITVYGDGSQRRTFCDVRDGARAILGLVENFDRLSSREWIAYNVGGTRDCSILELAEIIKECTGSDSTVEFIPISALPCGFDEIYKRKPNCELIQLAVGWEPKFDLRATIRDIIKSYAYEPIYD